MRDFAVIGGCLFLLLALLGIERHWVIRTSRRIPLRILVTGTRGKSSVVRLIAAGLGGAGFRVVSKTTGSQAVIEGPGDERRLVQRRSTPTPLEQRRLLRQAASARADALVVEGMSIRAESLRAESRRIIEPHLVVLTNIRQDHVLDLPDPGRAFAEAVPDGATCFVPAEIAASTTEQLRARAECRSVSPLSPPEWTPSHGHYEWPINAALALAVCCHAGASRERALEGMRSVRPDVGALSAWRWGGATRSWIAVNAFAANDPQSTREALRVARERWAPRSACIGLLNLRRDRGDRTMQWIDALEHEEIALDGLIIVGHLPWIVRRRLVRFQPDRVRVLERGDPDAVLRAAEQWAPSGGLIFGFGNIAGAGMRILADWRTRGEMA